MSKNSIIMQNILEIRFKKPFFSFFDIKGSFIDFISSNYDFKQIKYSTDGSSFQIGTENLDYSIFFTSKNFGFIKEGSENFNEFESKTEELFSIIEKFSKYKIENIVRIGTKSSIYYKKNGETFESLREKYKNKVLKDDFYMYKDSSFKTTDFSYTSTDIEYNDKNTKANIIFGPVDKNESLNKFFQGRKEFYNITKNPGFMYIIDFFEYHKEGLIFTSNEEIKEKALYNISKIESNFNEFKNFIFSE